MINETIESDEIPSENSVRAFNRTDVILFFVVILRGSSRFRNLLGARHASHGDSRAADSGTNGAGSESAADYIFTNAKVYTVNFFPPG